MIKSLIPPIFLPIVQKLNRWRSVTFFPNNKPYRDMVSHDYDALNLKFDNLWESKNWIMHVEKTLINSFNEVSDIHKSAVLKSIIILTHVYKNRPLTLYDFGGGCGVLVPPINKLANKLSLPISINVIDSFSNVKLGESYFNEYNNVRFFNQDKVKLRQLLDTSDPDDIIILNMSSLLQYVHPYDKFLESVLEAKKPKIVCITRFPRCEDSEVDAFAIQDITSSIGFCGSTVVNLFGKESLTKLMSKLGYEVILEEFDSIGSENYFAKCSDKKFQKMTLVSYTFMSIN